MGVLKRERAVWTKLPSAYGMIILRSMTLVLVGTALGATGGGVYGTLYGVMYGVIHRTIDSVIPVAAACAAAGAIAGAIMGVCRALDRALDQSEPGTLFTPSAAKAEHGNRTSVVDQYRTKSGRNGRAFCKP
jgi:hypothetical protein